MLTRTPVFPVDIKKIKPLNIPFEDSIIPKRTDLATTQFKHAFIDVPKKSINEDGLRIKRKHSESELGVGVKRPKAEVKETGAQTESKDLERMSRHKKNLPESRTPKMQTAHFSVPSTQSLTFKRAIVAQRSDNFAKSFEKIFNQNDFRTLHEMTKKTDSLETSMDTKGTDSDEEKRHLKAVKRNEETDNISISSPMLEKISYEKPSLSLNSEYSVYIEGKKALRPKRELEISTLHQTNIKPIKVPEKKITISHIHDQNEITIKEPVKNLGLFNTFSKQDSSPNIFGPFMNQNTQKLAVNVEENTKSDQQKQSQSLIGFISKKNIENNEIVETESEKYAKIFRDAKSQLEDQKSVSQSTNQSLFGQKISQNEKEQPNEHPSADTQESSKKTQSLFPLLSPTSFASPKESSPNLFASPKDSSATIATPHKEQVSNPFLSPPKDNPFKVSSQSASQTLIKSEPINKQGDPSNPFLSANIQSEHKFSFIFGSKQQSPSVPISPNPFIQFGGNTNLQIVNSAEDIDMKDGTPTTSPKFIPQSQPVAPTSFSLFSGVPHAFSMPSTPVSILTPSQNLFSCQNPFANQTGFSGPSPFNQHQPITPIAKSPNKNEFKLGQLVKKSRK